MRSRTQPKVRSSKQQWQLQEAKARFSELVRRAQTDGPQFVTRQGKNAVVIISVEEFNRLLRANQPESLVEFFANSPLAEGPIDLERERDYGREIDL